LCSSSSLIFAFSSKFSQNLLLPAKGKKGVDFEPKKEENFGCSIRGEWPFGLFCGFCFTNCLKVWCFEEFFLVTLCFVLFGCCKMGFWRKTRSKNDSYMNPSSELFIFSHFPLVILKLQVGFFSCSDHLSPSLFFHGFAFQSTILFSTYFRSEISWLIYRC